MRRRTTIDYLAVEKNQRELVEQNLSLRLRQQEATAWIGEYALRCSNLDSLLQETTRVVAETLGMPFCKILELLPNNKLFLRAGVGWKPGLVGTLTIGSDYDSQAGFTLLAQEPVIVEDLADERRFSDLEMLVDHNVISGMGVVIPGLEQPFGVLSVHSPQPRKFVSEDTRFIKAVAGILASAIERFRIEEQHQRSRDELAIILQGINEGVTVQNRQGEVIFANHAAAQMMGFKTVDEVVAAGAQKIVARFVMLDEAGKPFPLEELPGRKVLGGAGHASAKVRFRSLENGAEHWSIIDATPVYDDAGNVIQAVNIFRDITELVLSEQYQRFLAEASSLLNASLDYKTTLVNLAKLAVSGLADWCSVTLVSDDSLELHMAFHSDSEKMDLAREYQEKYPPDIRQNTGLAEVLRTGEPVYYPEITDEMLAATVSEPERLEILRQLGMKSAILVPLKARERTFGVITFIWAESGRRYTEREIALTNELGVRASMAIENAWLYYEAQTSKEELEQSVKKRTMQLETSNHQLLHEVEERRKAQRALQDSEALLNRIFEFAPDAMIIVNREGKIVRVNQQAETLFGNERESLIGKSIESLIPARFRGGHAHKRADYLGDMVTRSMGKGLELYAQSKDGREFPVDIMLAPLRVDREDLIICTIRDMTEQKRLQSELAELHRRLFESIEAERLTISQDLHDGPIQDLYSVAIYLESLRDILPGEPELEEWQATKENVQSIVQALRSVCGDLRPPTLGRFGLEKAIRSHLNKIRDTHQNIHFEAHLDSDGMHLSERVRLALFRVYQNSINNIIRHAQAENVLVNFHIADGHVTLHVQDDGKGFHIPKRWIDLAREGHFGLVSMVERVQAIGGTLDVQSEPGHGTSITVTLPLLGDVLANPAEPERSSG